jgi:glycosyltransferase involved in cell wall biosynthesis
MAERMQQQVREAIDRFRPDWILVSDDKQRLLLDCAMTMAPTRVILLLQTVFHLPFGPHATQHSLHQTALMARAQRLVAISEYLKDYLKVHGQLDSTVVRLPVFGTGPFHARESGRNGLVTMVNPCIEKGVGIFLALAEWFPGVQFAAVPTWGADDSVLAALGAAANVTILPPADDIDEILKETRILLAPSLWPETFGYVVVEAMLRGIPVLASDRGGLPEAKLGVDYVIPVRSAEWRNGAYVSPPQDIRPWTAALSALLNDEQVYRRCATASHRAALEFVSHAQVDAFEAYMRDCAGQ